MLGYLLNRAFSSILTAAFHNGAQLLSPIILQHLIGLINDRVPKDY